MRKGIVFLVFLLTLCSCKKKEEDDDIKMSGTYKLIEILVDPGDGSGKFEAVKSSKKIEFTDEGKVKCNGEICSMSIASNTPSEGDYSTSKFTITVPECDPLKFELDGDIVIIKYPCLETCKAKYEKQ